MFRVTEVNESVTTVTMWTDAAVEEGLLPDQSDAVLKALTAQTVIIAYTELVGGLICKTVPNGAAVLFTRVS